VSTSTRRLVFFTLVVVLLTIPAEILLLRALAVPDQKLAVRQWAMSLPASELAWEARRIQAYPVLYRKEMMRAASPELRARVFQAHFDAYVQARLGLDVNTVALITSLRSMLTPEVFDAPTETRKAELRGIANQVAGLLGEEEAVYLMERLGPADGTFASFEPTAMFLTNKVRGLFVAFAQGFDCDCEMDRGCYSGGSSCSFESGCSTYYGWPGCGYLWQDPCTGGCVGGW
jgi:hypothetical protein